MKLENIAESSLPLKGWENEFHTKISMQKTLRLNPILVNKKSIKYKAHPYNEIYICLFDR